MTTSSPSPGLKSFGHGLRTRARETNIFLQCFGVTTKLCNAVPRKVAECRAEPVPCLFRGLSVPKVLGGGACRPERTDREPHPPRARRTPLVQRSAYQTHLSGHEHFSERDATNRAGGQGVPEGAPPGPQRAIFTMRGRASAAATILNSL